MKLFSTVYIIFYSILLLASPAASSELTKISRVNAKDIVQLYLTFDTPPRFSSKSNKKRIDIIFHNTEKKPSLNFFPPDEKIVKILSQQIDNKLIVSLFFRYEPQSHKISLSGNNNVVFEVLLGNQYSKSYQNLAQRLKGLTVVDRTTPDFTNPHTISPYIQDWKTFYLGYESGIEIELPVRFTVLPFPIIALLPPGKDKNLEIFNDEASDLAVQQLWDQLASWILKTIETTLDLRAQKLLALTYGEILLRKGDFEGAYKQLYLLQDKYQDELLGVYAQYLLVLLRALHEDPYLANYEFRKLEQAITVNSALAPHFYLSQVETALASSEFPRLNKLLLRDDIALPPGLAERVTIRHADYWYSIDQSIKAYASYKLLENSSLLPTQPYSHNGYCSTLYDQKNYRSSAVCYKNLASLVDDKASMGLISFRESMSKLKFTKRDRLIDDFSQIENAFPGTEAGYLSAIKKNDLLLLQDMAWAEKAIENYRKISLSATKRSVRGEARFKEILLHALTGKKNQAVSMLMELLREFQSGDIRISAQALLIDLLPSEIKRLVDEQQYMTALVLAKQNRQLFQNNWLNGDFLVDIAKAYHNIGVYDEAQKLYLYLIEIMPVDRREAFFLPMIQSTFDYGNFVLVEDYAAQYIYNYPKGKFNQEILYLRLQALVSDERLQDALALLPQPLPDFIPTKRLAGMLYFRTGNYKESAEVLEQLSKQIELTSKERFIFAESLFETDKVDSAKKIYNTVFNTSPYYDQSLYRLAQIARKNGEEEEATRLFTQIIEKGKNERWVQYAERELQYGKLKDLY